MKYGFLFLLTGSLYAQKPSYNFRYERYTHTEIKGDSIWEVPSKCDCDYFLRTAVLYNDSTCTLFTQKGRLTPLKQEEYGTWNLQGESLLTITITEYQGSLFIDEKIYPSKNKRKKATSPYEYTFYVKEGILDELP